MRTPNLSPIRPRLLFCIFGRFVLPKYLRGELEQVQKRALGCIFPVIPYHDALISRAKIKSVDEHQEELTERLFKNILCNPTCMHVYVGSIISFLPLLITLNI